MSTSKATESVEPATTPEPNDATESAAPEISDWQFRGDPPTQDQVLGLLRTLRPCHGVEYVDFADWVQALPTRLKVKVPHPNNPNVTVDEYVDAWTLYMTVAGRIAMLNEIAENNDWRVDFLPEPHTPTGIPGMLQYDEQKVVYREAVVIHSGDFLLGSKPGTAWVPTSGGKSAEGSNPFEVVETSARGRAIAAWGIGILPGSGVASVEEMHAASRNRRANEGERGGGNGGDRPRRRMSREDLMGKTLTSVEEFRQKRGVSEEQMNSELVQYLAGLGVKQPENEDGTVAWDKVKDGQLQLVANKMAEHLREMFAQEWTGA